MLLQITQDALILTYGNNRLHTAAAANRSDTPGNRNVSPIAAYHLRLTERRVAAAHALAKDLDQMIAIDDREFVAQVSANEFGAWLAE